MLGLESPELGQSRRVGGLQGGQSRGRRLKLSCERGMRGIVRGFLSSEVGELKAKEHRRQRRKGGGRGAGRREGVACELTSFWADASWSLTDVLFVLLTLSGTPVLGCKVKSGGHEDDGQQSNRSGGRQVEKGRTRGSRGGVRGGEDDSREGNMTLTSAAAWRRRPSQQDGRGDSLWGV